MTCSRERRALVAGACVAAAAIAYGLRPSNVKKLPVPAASEGTTVKAGYGLPFCYIGMSEYMLSDDWTPGPKLFPDVYYEPNSAKEGHFNLLGWGVKATSRNRRVAGIVIKVTQGLPEFDTGVFGGKFELGVSRSSNIEDIFRAYGEPDAISFVKVYNEEKVSEVDSRRVSLDYLEHGIDFRFVDGRLHVVGIGAPESPPFESWLSEDIGDTRALRELAKRIASEKQADQEQSTAADDTE